VGAPGDDSGRGAVYVFARSGDSWTQRAKLTASDGATGDQLGLSVAIDGDAIVAGAPHDDFGGTTGLGSAYTFARTGPAARTETAKLTASDAAGGDQLGWSVAIEGDVIVAGAYSDDIGANEGQGSAYTFARTGPVARTQAGKLTASDGATGDHLGVSVAIEGDAIVAGAADDGVGANADQGSAYTFARTGPAARTETAKLTASDGAAGDVLGVSVAIDGDAIVAGAPFDNVGANAGQGSARVFLGSTVPAPTPTPSPTAPPSTQTTPSPSPIPTTSTPVRSFAGVRLVTRRVTYARRFVTVRLSCPAGTVGRCSGRTKLTARRRTSSRRVTLGRARFSIAAGQQARVRVRISHAGRRLLRRVPQLRGRAVNAARDGAGRSKTTVARVTIRRRHH
jgi:hypothetical protein